MATVVVYAKQGGKYSFFIGKESMFMRDAFPEVASMETHVFPPNTTVTDMRTHFREVAKTLSEAHGFRVQFDTPKQNAETHVGKVRFRMEPKSPKYGIVKGGMEPQDAGQPLLTAVREFREECMNADIPKTMFVRAKQMRTTSVPIQERAVFYVDVTAFKGKVQTTMDAWKTTHYGELFGTEFKSLEEVCSIWKKLNVTSKIAFETFFQEHGIRCAAGGGRRRHSSKMGMDRRGSRRTKSSR